LLEGQSENMIHWFKALYYLCVEFMVDLANLLEISYRDSNILILFGLIPVIIATDSLIVLWLLFQRFREKQP
jgi:hypothetical protein